jgi:5-methylcytosine-specific restriction endonuclease McrA
MPKRATRAQPLGSRNSNRKSGKPDPKRLDRANATQRGYDRRWRNARLGYLRSHPFCVSCAKQDRYITANVVDHVIPHKGDQDLFWDTDNWQALCKPCHDRKTATESQQPRN